MSKTTFSSITDTLYGRLTLFGFLYFVQGALLAYVLVFNNLYLRHAGASAAQLSLLNGLLVVPFIMKVAFGVLSDKVALQLPLLGRGHRLPYISLGLVLTTSGGVAAATIPPVAQYPLFLATALFIAFGLALYDTVTDGLAIDVTPPDQRALMQGTMVIGRALGLVMLAAVYGRIITAFSWPVVFWIVVIFTLLPQLLLPLAREPAERPAEQTFSWEALRVLWRPEIGRFALYAVVYSIAIYGANAIIALFTNEELGGTLVQIGDAAALGGLGMVAGGAAGVALARRMSIWQQAMWTTVAVTATLLLIAGMADLDNIVFIFLLWGFCLAAAELVYVTLAMAKSDRRMGAGHFAIFMAISNAGTGVGQATSTGLIDSVDFRWIFVGLALVSLLSFPLLLTMRADDAGMAKPVVPAPWGS